MDIKAFAKVNICLDVTKERDDGYHEVRMIMQSIGLYDLLKFEKRDKGIEISCEDLSIPCDNRNIVYKVLDNIKKKYNVPYGMEISIEKNIPSAAGLGGGSSDGAAAIIAANSIWGLNLSYDDMISIGKIVGADVPFFIKGGTALAEGIGDILTFISPFKGAYILIAKPPINISTKDVYDNFRLTDVVKRPDIYKMIDNIEKGDIEHIGNNMINVLETVTIKNYPIIGEIKNIMMQAGALGSLMSGSGPSVFGIFETKNKAKMCRNRLSDYLKDVFIVEPVGKGQEINK